MMGLAPPKKEYKDYELSMIGIYSKNREEWIITDMAAILYNLTTVPLNDSIEGIIYIV